MNRLRLGYIGVYLASCFLTVSLLSFITHAQQVGRNVNMVSGTELPGGDPYLQRQNEPSGAVSTRNPMHLLVGANDYRTVDLPGVLGAVETGDAWQGVFKSIDGGQSWFSTLLPGFPQDQSPEGLASPTKDYEAASDPVVRAGTHGMFYYAGMAFDRGDSAPSAAFVARYIDLNNKENADPMEYIDTHLIDYRTGYWDSVEPEPEDFRAGFIDKPWLAVDIPRSGAETCSIAVEQKDREGNPHAVTQQFPGGNVYVAYTVIKAIDDELHSTVLFSYSSDCGESWSSPKKLAAAGRIFQGATIAVDPTSGAVYVSWRQFEQFDPVLNINHPNAIFIARSDDGGKKFSKEAQVAAITAFDQPTLPKNALPDFRGFRFNAYPTMTVDGDGRVYIAWSEYGLGAAEDARVVVSTSGDGGQSWSSPVAVDDAVVDDEIEGMTPVRCRQVFPSLSLSSGHLMVAYYDFREDILEEETPLSFIGDFIGSPEVEFHHSVDVRVAQAKPGPNPVFTSYPDDPSAQVSRYLWVTDVDNAGAREQTQHNKPNLPLFDQGSKPFMGDYVDIIASPAFVQDGNGNWVYNLDGDKAGIFHAIWADNRDVRLPTNEDWSAYQPPVSDQPAPFPDPSLADYPNGECDVDLTGMRDQNIYTSQITEGLYVGSPSNTKPLSSEVLRAFVAFVRNATRDAKSYRLTVANQPPGGTASFHQFELVTELDVTIAAHSSTSRPVFVTSTEETATVHILVQEITEPEGVIIPPINGGLQGLIELNPDVLNPEILNPEILNPEQTNADINTVEIHNPEILNPEILNPEILNPEILNPEILNPEILNPEILNPEILNPEILNPEILNPEILNPEILNPEILNPEILNPEILNNPRLTDITWTVRNDGNTTSSYTAKPFIAQELPEAANFRFQLLIYRIHATPAVNAITCELETEPLRQRQHHELIVDIRNPEILNPEILNPEILNHDPDVATFYAAPGETVRVTLRMLDPDITDEYDLNTDAVALATISHAVDSDDATNNVMQPDVEVQTSTGVPIDILTKSLPNAVTGRPYSAMLVAAGGIPPLTWSEQSSILGVAGTACEGLTLDHASGIIHGTAVNEGTCGPFTIRVVDSEDPPHIDIQQLSILVEEMGATVEWVSRYNGPAIGPDEAHDIAVDSNGNVYMTGGSYGAGTSWDYVTAKYDSSGNELWLRRYNGFPRHSDQASAIEIDSEENVYVTGYSSGLDSFTDFLTIKYDSSGNELWVARYNGPSNRGDQAYDLTVDSAGNVYVTGISDSGSYPTSNQDYATIKYDSDGNELWVALYDGSAGESDHAAAIAIDMNGNAYVTGYSREVGMGMFAYTTVKYDSAGNELWVKNDRRGEAFDIAVHSSGDVYVTGRNNESDFLTIMYDSLGNEVWATIYDNDQEQARALVVDPAGNAYVTGRSSNVGSGIDFATVAYDSSGNELWVKRYDGPAGSSDYGEALTLDHMGNLYVTGQSFGIGTGCDYATIKYDSLGNELWVSRRDGGGNADDIPHAIVADSAGNVYVTGESMGSDTGVDCTTVKYDGSGSELWASSYNFEGNGSDEARAIAVDGVGNVYVTGETNVGSGGGTNTDYLTIKYEGSGYVAWTTRYDGPSFDHGRAIAVDSSGSTYVTGTSYVGASRDDYVTVKYDGSGNELWAVRYSGPANLDDRVQAMAIDSLGSVYVTGDSRGTDSSIDYATVKYDSSGNEVWVKRYNGPGNSTDQPIDIAVNSSGCAYVTGYSGGIDTGPDITTVKYDAAGNEVWVSRYNGLRNIDDYATGIAVDSEGNVYVTGASYQRYLTYTTIKYDNAGNEVWVRQAGINTGSSLLGGWDIVLDSSTNVYVTGSAGGDYMTIKYDSTGNELWARTYNGPGDDTDLARRIALDSTGNVYVTGYSPGVGTENDIATIKYDAMGNEIWVERYDGPGSWDDEAWGIALDAAGNVYVAGASHGEETNSDYVLVKYKQN